MIVNGPAAKGVVIRREISLAGLPELEADAAASEDGIMLNHSYFDVRGCSLADAEEILTEEDDLLTELAAIGWRSDEADEIVWSFIEGGSVFMAFDPGVGAAIMALSAAGATPISSCNGGLAGSDREHAEEIPTILFAGGPQFRNDLIQKAIEEADLGLVDNGGYAEVFGDELLKFNDLARRLLSKLAG